MNPTKTAAAMSPDAGNAFPLAWTVVQTLAAGNFLISFAIDYLYVQTKC